MDDQYFVFATAGVILVYFLAHVVARKFDPFAPVWLFLVGYVQVYVIQALSYHEWALDVRGKDLVTAANFRALWAVLWFLAVYHSRGSAGGSPRRCPGRRAAGRRPGRRHLAPPLVLWGLFCAGVMIKGGLQAAGDDLGRGSAAPLVPVRDDGRGDPADRDGPVPVRVPAALPPGGAHGRGCLCRRSGCSTASGRTR